MRNACYPQILNSQVILVSCSWTSVASTINCPAVKSAQAVDVAAVAKP